MEDNVIFEASNISSFVNRKYLVNDVTFSLHTGEVCAMIGNDTSGKSSLCKLIAGALPLTSGDIYIEGENVSYDSSLRKKISVSLDPPTFFKFQTAIDNVKYLLSLKGKYNYKKVIALIKKFSLLEKMNRYVFSLKKEDLKKFSLIVTLASDAKIYIFDEPFVDLSEEDKKIFLSMLKELKNSAIILTGDVKEDFEDMANVFIFLNDKTIDHIEANEKWKNFNQKRYTFIVVKQPNFAGKIIREGKDLKVYIEENKILIPKTTDTELEEILKMLKEKKVTIYSAGHREKDDESISESLKSYFSEEK